jgi:hypothetical protein
MPHVTKGAFIAAVRLKESKCQKIFFETLKISVRGCTGNVIFFKPQMGSHRCTARILRIQPVEIIINRGILNGFPLSC